MDKFLTFPGQQPIYLGDIDFMQTAVGNALKNLLISYTGNADGSAILAGVEITKTETDVSWSEGVIAIDGDIIPVAAGSITGGASSDLYFQVITTLSGSRTMKDGTVRQCWQSKSATLTTTETDYPVLNFGRAGAGTQATVYGFDAFPRYGYTFAVLANCGGAWIFSFRVTTESAGTTLFSADVKDLPADIVRKLGDNSADVLFHHVVTDLFVDPYPSGGDPSYHRQAAVVDLYIANNNLHITVISTDTVPTGTMIGGSIIIPIF